MATSKNSERALRLTPAGESGEDMLEFMEEMTENCDEVQKMVLNEILKQNGEAEYLRRHGVVASGDGGGADREDFKARVPVVNYEDLKPDIQRIANGDRSAILCGHPISEFLTSSGTSNGERKLMPTIKEDLDRRQLLYNLLTPIMNRYVPGLHNGKALYFMFTKSETRTPGGFLARPVLTSYYKSHHFQLRRPHSGDLSHTYTSPIAAVLSSDSHQSMYIQMLCGLHHRLEVLRVGAVFASGLLRAIHFLQTHWRQLASDIAAGELSPSITDPALRSSVAHLLRPNPNLATFISEECSKPDWAGIITRIWPNTKYLDVVITGAMAQYIPTLQYFSGGLPMASTMYASSECYFGLNLKPMCSPDEIYYTIMPNLGFFEFLPIDGDELVDLAAVEVGKEYELVVTTYAGLYRYRVGDVLRVMRFYNSAPQFKFVRRKNVVLSIEADKTDETELQRAVERAAAVLAAATPPPSSSVSVVEYTSRACTDTIPGHYVIYWELLWRRKGELEGGVMERCCLEMEEEMNSVYRQSRVADRSIGPLEIRVVRTGTFEELMDYAVARGASINQYKVPRCIDVKPVLELLDSRVVCSYFSKGLPRWSPGRFD